jgi:hypothetical protein
VSLVAKAYDRCVAEAKKADTASGRINAADLDGVEADSTIPLVQLSHLAVHRVGATPPTAAAIYGLRHDRC